MITDVRAREVLDCRGLPTLQVELELDAGVVGRADVPAGRSTGSNEAFELRDGGRRYGGFGVRGAVRNVAGEIRAALVGTELGTQRQLDERLIALDGTPDKRRLGGNALAGVSLAAARAAAAAAQVPLYRWVSAEASVLPMPLVNLINGGKHASNDLAFQEIIVVPRDFATFAEALQAASEINLALAGILLAKFGKVALNTGDEGGYAPPLDDPEEALSYLRAATDEAGYGDRCVYGLDCAATHLYDPAAQTYAVAGRAMTRAELMDYYAKLVADYGVATIEDPLHEEDFEGVAELTERLGVQIVGDDLFVTNAARVEKGAAMGAANALLWKFNQIGTLTEALDAAEAASRHDMAVVVSERSGETEDAIISDLVVGLGAGQIKTGAPVRGERTSKYNRLLVIEEELGSRAVYAGTLGLLGASS